jgi:hypothetical protein
MTAPYVIQLHKRGHEVDEFFFSTRTEQDKKVSTFKDLGIYRQIWWGYGPSEDPDDWEEFGNWEPEPLTVT